MSLGPGGRAPARPRVCRFHRDQYPAAARRWWFFVRRQVVFGAFSGIRLAGERSARATSAGLARELHGGAGVQRHVVLHVAPPVLDNKKDMLRVPRRLAAMGRLRLWPSRRIPALSVAAVLVLLAVIPVLVAQSTRRPPPGLQEATRALIEGRYDEVSALTEKLDQQDPQVAAVKARALSARGR
jgi:hypothetical protein